jgi:hypothetical protein
VTDRDSLRLKWFWAAFYIRDEEICSRAAANGHLEVLKCARENGCEWYSDTCRKAAENGRLEVLKWARANGWPCDWETCADAAQNGHFEVVKWAKANGWGEVILKLA